MLKQATKQVQAAKAVVSLEAEITLKGDGAVNYDETKVAKWEAVRIGAKDIAGSNNQKIPKTEARKDADGTVTLYPKVSSNCLRGAIFSDSPSTQSSVAFLSPSLVLMKYSGYSDIIRGWTEAGVSIGRSSALTVTSAVWFDGSLLKTEVSSSSGPRNDLSYRHLTTLGEATYMAKASLSLTELPVMSLSTLTGRRSMSEDQIEDWSKAFAERSGIAVPKPKFFRKKTDSGNIAEKMVLLPESAVKLLAIHLVDRILKTSIMKAGGYLQVESVVFKLKEEGEPNFKFDRGQVFKVEVGNEEQTEQLIQAITDANILVNYEEVSGAFALKAEQAEAEAIKIEADKNAKNGRENRADKIAKRNGSK